MSGLILTLTENFDAEAIRAELSEHLRVDHPKFVYLRTADPPSILHLLGDVLSWLPLKKAAEFLLSELAKRDGNTTWDRLASLLKINAVKPLADVTETLEKAATSVDRKVTMHVGIDIPDDYFGTALSIKPTASAGEMACLLAPFIVHAEQISKAMQAEIEAGHAPLGGARIELRDDESLLIRWVCQADFSRHELRISVT